MPVLDKCEPQLLNAFRNDGWAVSAKPFVLPTHDRNVYADFGHKRGANSTMVDFPECKRSARVVVQARLDGEMVVIEEDTTDR